MMMKKKKKVRLEKCCLLLKIKENANDAQITDTVLSQPKITRGRSN